MQKHIIIRDACPEDAPLLAQAERNIAATPGRLVSHPSELRDEDFAQTIALLTANPCGKYLVAQIDGQTVGHGFLAPLHRIAIAHVVNLTLAVHEGFQGCGVGKAILGHLIAWAKETPGVEKIELNARHTNAAAIGLYRKMGFTEEGRLHQRIKLTDGTYLDDILMALKVL
jgi:putative acetyltransferase